MERRSIVLIVSVGAALALPRRAALTLAAMPIAIPPAPTGGAGAASTTSWHSVTWQGASTIRL